MRLIEDQTLALSTRPYAPTARPTQALLLVSMLVDVLVAGTKSGEMAADLILSLQRQVTCRP